MIASGARLLFLCFVWTAFSFPLSRRLFLRRLKTQVYHGQPLSRIVLHQTSTRTTDCEEFADLADQLQNALETSWFKSNTCRVRFQTTPRRCGLVADKAISKGDVMLALPIDDSGFELSAKLAREIVFQDVLPSSFDGWTGDAGLIALLILNEVALSIGKGSCIPNRSLPIQELMKCWARVLPSAQELDHPLLWDESSQEVLQSSSTSKIYRRLDDIEEDATWLIANVFDKDRRRFPETVDWNGREISCFGTKGFLWAVSLALSRSFFLDGSLRLIPVLDMCNHDDDGVEVRVGGQGAFGFVKCAQLVASKAYKAGEEVFCSYGPKSAAEYLLEYGFVPNSCWKTPTAVLCFEMDPNDRFYADKLDILEFETGSAPLDPVQSFDVSGKLGLGGSGEPDPAMLQFLRLSSLGGTDAFLLESIFRRDVWSFMAYPVSEMNELKVFDTIIGACQVALDELRSCPGGGPDACTRLRESESIAISQTLEYLTREREALDLKEYYQERRLKDLGLDSGWSPEDDVESGVGLGQGRTPGGSDYDW